MSGQFIDEAEIRQRVEAAQSKAQSKSMLVRKMFADALLAEGEAGHWFALRVSTKCERSKVDVPITKNDTIEERVSWRLGQHGIYSVVPKCKDRVRIPRKRGYRMVIRPAINGLVFVYLPLRPLALIAMQYVVGVAGMVGNNAGPVHIQGDKMETFIRMADDGYLDANARASLTVKPKDTVTIKDGPFADFEAIVLECAGNKRLACEVSMFGRDTRVELGFEQIKLLHKAAV